MRRCNFESINDQFNFGRYNGYSLADVMDLNPSYLEWCIKYCTGVIVLLQDEAVHEIKKVYPEFLMDALFESKRDWHLLRADFDDTEDDYYYDEDRSFEDNEDVPPTFGRYAGSWAQEVEGYSDDDIDIIFDGDPSAYWSID